MTEIALSGEEGVGDWGTIGLQVSMPVNKGKKNFF